MVSDETPRDGLTWYQWAMREHTRLQALCIELWDSLNDHQSKEEWDVSFASYNAACDRMDALEALPQALFEWQVVRVDTMPDGKRWARRFYGDGAEKERALVPPYAGNGS